MSKVTNVDTALAELAAKLHGDERPATGPGRVARCGRCRDMAPTQPWPLGDRRPLLCDPCWLWRVREPIVVELWDGTGELVVWSTHPQRGRVLRGSIRPVGTVPDGLRPAIRWQLFGPEPDDLLGEHVGDYVDAEARLLDATAWADRLDEAGE